MQNQLIPTEELEMLISEMNERLDALEVQVSNIAERERSGFVNEKMQQIENVQNQINQLNDNINRQRSVKTKQPAIIIHPKYSV